VGMTFLLMALSWGVRADSLSSSSLGGPVLFLQCARILEGSSSMEMALGPRRGVFVSPLGLWGPIGSIGVPSRVASDMGFFHAIST
jgi:hypothetical protein